MKLFTCTNHDGHYSIGTASIILAESKEDAARLLSAELSARGLDPTSGFTLQEVDMNTPKAIILHDGNY